MSQQYPPQPNYPQQPGQGYPQFGGPPPGSGQPGYGAQPQYNDPYGQYGGAPQQPSYGPSQGQYGAPAYPPAQEYQAPGPVYDQYNVPQYPPGGMAPGYPPAASQTNTFAKLWWVWVLALVLVIGVAFFVVRGSSNDGGGSLGSPGIGDTITVGDVKYTLNDVTTGVTEIGDSYFTDEPEGQFVIVNLTVEGTKTGAYFSAMNLHLVRPNKELADWSITLSLEDELLFEDLDPGYFKTGNIAFDIPADEDPLALRIADGYGSSRNTGEFTFS